MCALSLHSLEAYADLIGMQMGAQPAFLGMAAESRADFEHQGCLRQVPAAWAIIYRQVIEDGVCIFCIMGFFLMERTRGSHNVFGLRTAAITRAGEEELAELSNAYRKAADSDNCLSMCLSMAPQVVKAHGQ